MQGDYAIFTEYPEQKSKGKLVTSITEVELDPGRNQGSGVL